MRIAILGSEGMLGSEIAKLLPDAVALTHSTCDILKPEHVVCLNAICDVVINCAGVCNKYSRVNSLGPKYLRLLFTKRIIHISTDCVYGMSKCTAHNIFEIPRPNTPYGLSKYLGEIEGSLNIRTSFVGTRHGLLAWLLSLPRGSEVEGWTNAWWSGSIVQQVAKEIVKIVDSDVESGLLHLSTLRPITKHRAVYLINEAFDLDLCIKSKQLSQPINRGLIPTNMLPNFEKALTSL